MENGFFDKLISENLERELASSPELSVFRDEVKGSSQQQLRLLDTVVDTLKLQIQEAKETDDEELTSALEQALSDLAKRFKIEESEVAYPKPLSVLKEVSSSKSSRSDQPETGLRNPLTFGRGDSGVNFTSKSPIFLQFILLANPKGTFFDIPNNPPHKKIPTNH